MEEMWKDIPGYEGLYQASTEGRIRSVDRVVDVISKWGTPGKWHIKGKILHYTYAGQSKEYQHVTLSKDGHIKGVCVHKLVALTFPEICGEWFEGAEVSHLDENPHNNKPENLRWVEHTTNINWGYRNERSGLSQRNRPDSSKPVVQYTLDGEYVAEYPSGGDAERKTGIKRPNISACCRGIVEAAGGYIWKHKNGS